MKTRIYGSAFFMLLRIVLLLSIDRQRLKQRVRQLELGAKMETQERQEMYDLTDLTRDEVNALFNGMNAVPLGYGIPDPDDPVLTVRRKVETLWDRAVGSTAR